MAAVLRIRVRRRRRQFGSIRIRRNELLACAVIAVSLVFLIVVHIRLLQTIDSIRKSSVTPLTEWSPITPTEVFENYNDAHQNALAARDSETTKSPESISGAVLSRGQVVPPTVLPIEDAILKAFETECKKRDEFVYFAGRLGLCECVPSALVQQNVSIENQRRFQVSLLSDLAEVSPGLDGGHFAPSSCLARQQLAVIVPLYAPDEAHLTVFLRWIHKILQLQQAEYKVYIVRCEWRMRLGRLLNIAFRLALDSKFADCILFHDVHLIGLDSRNMLNCRGPATHLATAPYPSKQSNSSASGNLSSSFLLLAIRPWLFQQIGGFSTKAWNIRQLIADFAERISEEAGFEVLWKRTDESRIVQLATHSRPGDCWDYYVAGDSPRCFPDEPEPDFHLDGELVVRNRHFYTEIMIKHNEYY